MRTQSLVLTVFLLAGCAEPYASGRLAPVGLPQIEQQPADATANQVDARPVDAGVAGLPSVPPARVTEADVFGYLQALVDEFGSAGLLRLEAGTTLAERLRYCTGLMFAGRARDVLPELERLARFHADNPMVWRQLASARDECEQIERAVEAARKARALAAQDGFQTCPSMTSFLGALLLGEPTTREEGIRLLREELASGTDHVRAAQYLADHFCVRERHLDALACLDRSAERAPEEIGTKLQRAEVLLDLYKIRDAIDVLTPLAAGETVKPRTLQLLMRAYLLSDDFDRGLTVLERILAMDGLDQRARTVLRGKREEVMVAKQTGQREQYEEWEILAIIRGHPNLALRRGVLRSVIRQGNAGTRDRVLGVAFRSDSAVVRAEALTLLLPKSTTPLQHLRAGLADPDGKVRAIAANHAAKLTTDRDKVAALLIEYLATESESYTFRQIHEALVKVTGEAIELPFDAADDPVRRRQVVESWRRGK